MIIRLDSIEEESIIIEEAKNAKKNSLKSKKRSIMRKFDDEFDQL